LWATTETLAVIPESLGRNFFHFPLDYSGEFLHTRHPDIIVTATKMLWQEEANVVRLPTHITALSAANAWSSYRPRGRRLVCASVVGTALGEQPRPAFQLPG
jgi:hypothetical protein